MKKLSVFFLSVMTVLSVYGQDITGKWNGILRVPGGELVVVFNLILSGNEYTATMDSPDQGAFGIPVKSTGFVNSVLKLDMPDVGIEYEGTLNNGNIIVGTFKQGGQPFPFNLSKETIMRIRAQTPVMPYPYYSEDIKIENKKDNIELAGTLTLPAKEGKYPVVILISGSGPQDRNGEFSGHKPYQVLADYLTRHGMAVLRYDDRGIAGSKGDFGAATTLDFATDVESAIGYLKTRPEIIRGKIGLIGHSEGGMIAPIVAQRSADVSFMVLLSGPGIPIDQLLLMQQTLIGRAAGAIEADITHETELIRGAYEISINSDNSEKLKIDLSDYFDKIPESDKTSLMGGKSQDDYIAFLASPWMQYFLKYNPSINLERVKCPVLALGGSKDLQVPATVNLAGIKAALTKGGNNNVTIIELAGLNHLFQECESGSPSEYTSIGQTFSPAAMEEIAGWIMK